MLHIRHMLVRQRHCVGGRHRIPSSVGPDATMQERRDGTTHAQTDRKTVVLDV